MAESSGIRNISKKADLDKIWKEFCSMVKELSTSAEEQFTLLLIKSQGGHSYLAKTIEFLCNNEDNDEEISVFGTFTFLKSILLLTIHSFELGDDVIGDMLSFVLVQARHFSTPALVKVVQYCLQYLTVNPDMTMPQRWIEVFGKSVSVVAMRYDIEFKEDTLDGGEFKQEVITELCRAHWGPHNAASLIAALREMQTTDTHHISLVLEQAKNFMQDVEPSCVPSFVVELILLAGHTSPSTTISLFNDYFGRIFGTNGEDGTVDKRKALGKTVCHFVQGARTCEPLLKELVKRIKASQFCHSIIISSFMMSVALGLTGIVRFRQTVIDAIKATILKWFTEIHLGKSSSWYSACTGELSEDSVKSCFAHVFDVRSGELDFMFDGLKELGIALLGMEQTGTKDVQLAKKRCNLIGDYILVSLVSKKNYYLPQLVNEFLKNQSSITNIECLARCLKKVIYPVVRKEHVGSLRELIHNLPLMTVETATPIIKAILPSLQLSADLLGEFVMVIRKTIWKSIEARRVSVTATILLLCNSRIVGDIPRSQFSNTQFFRSSQLGNSQTNILGSSSKNESICYEVLEILRRFFTQQFEVRELLYIGIFNVARQNPELISFLCTHVENQMKTYIKTESTGIGSTADSHTINMEEMSNYAASVTPVPDPIGYFVQCLSFLLTKSRNIYGDEDGSFSEDTPASVLACSKTMNVWISDIGEILSEDFNKRLAKRSQLKPEFIVQIMQTVEALIEYLCLGGITSKRHALAVLFEKFNSLALILKSPDNPGGKRKKGTKAPTKKGVDLSALSDTNNTTAGADFLPQKIPTKKITYSYIITTENLVEIIGKLYEDDITGVDPLAPIRLDQNFEKFLFSNLKQKIHTLKQKAPLKERDKDPNALTGHLARIAGLLWSRAEKSSFVASDEPMEVDEEVQEVPVVDGVDMDESRLELAVEILRCLFQLGVPDHQFILRRFLSESERTPYDELFSIFFEQLTIQIQNGRKYLIGKRAGKGIYDLFVLLEIFAIHLPAGKNLVLTNALLWFTTFLGDKSSIFLDEEQLCPSHAEAILSAYIVIVSKANAIPERFLPIARRVLFLLSDVAGDTLSFDTRDSKEKSWLVTSYTATTILHQFAIYIEYTLTTIKDIVGRFNCIYVDEEKISTWRNSCCAKLLFLARILTNLVRAKFTVGPWIDVLRRATVQFFVIMTNITESFVNYHTKSDVGFRSRQFENLVKAVGTDFKIRAEAMVHQIEEIRRKAVEGNEDPKKKGQGKSVKNSITKDTKTMPALIYNIEKYEQQLILLCEKTKVNLLAGTRLSAPRDFRIIYNKERPRPVELAVPSRSPELRASTSSASTRSDDATSAIVEDTTDDEPRPGPSSGMKRRRLGLSR